jgi:hypothetical protein
MQDHWIYVPVHESSLLVHLAKLVGQPRPGLANGRSAGKAADGSVNLGKVATRHNCWRLVVDAHLEASWAPGDKLERKQKISAGLIV